MIVADTNVLYELADRRDEHHAGCIGWLRGNGEVLPVPPIVIAEALLPDRQVPQARSTGRFLGQRGHWRQ